MISSHARNCIRSSQKSNFNFSSHNYQNKPKFLRVTTIQNFTTCETKTKTLTYFKDVDAGEINIIVSPLKKVKPRFRFMSLPSISFVFSRTKLMCISKARRVPTNLFPLFNCTITSWLFELFNKSKGRSIPLTIIING